MAIRLMQRNQSKMNALTMFEATPRIKPDTAKKLYNLIENDMSKSLRDLLHIHGIAITIHIWQGALDKEITNENDVAETIQKIENKIKQYQG